MTPGYKAWQLFDVLWHVTSAQGIIYTAVVGSSGTPRMAASALHRSRIPAAPASEGETLSVFPSLVLSCRAWLLQGVVVIQSLLP